MCGCVLDLVLEAIFLFFVNIGAYILAMISNGARIVNSYIRSKTS
jgi:hypothetical protein